MPRHSSLPCVASASTLSACCLAVALVACSDKVKDPAPAAMAPGKPAAQLTADTPPSPVAPANATSSCALLDYQRRTCDMIPDAVAAQALGVDVAQVEKSDNNAIMSKSPQLLSCTYEAKGDRAAGSVNVGQVERSTAVAFKALYQVQDAAAVAGGIDQGVALAEKTTGQAVEGDRRAKASAQAVEMIKGLQYGRVDGLGDMASSMYSGEGRMAYLITLVGEQKFVVKVIKGPRPREQNLEVAKQVAADVVGRCR